MMLSQLELLIFMLMGWMPVRINMIPPPPTPTHPHPGKFPEGHVDIIKWKLFPPYWPIVWGIHRPPVNSPHKDQRRGALMFPLICAWTNRWANNRDAGDLRRHRDHYDVIVMWVATWCTHVVSMHSWQTALPHSLQICLWYQKSVFSRCLSYLRKMQEGGVIR